MTLAWAGPALAESTQIETVVVTAERRATDLQKTPISATVLTGDDLKARGIDALDQLQFSTPSLTVQDSGSNVLVNMRGIGKNDGGIQVSSGVLTYRDGVSTSFNGFLADEPYYDISNVQVLRGPQGTFAGQNATGGAIFITEADPSFDGVSGFGEFQYGSYNDVRMQGAINIPLTDDLAIRVATDDETRDTFFHMSGPFTGNPGNLHTTNWRLSTLWKPTSAFTAELKLDYNYIDHGAPLAAPFTGSTKHIFDVGSDAHLQGIDQQGRAVLRLNYEFDSGIQLRSISGYQYGRISYALDVDGTDKTIFSLPPVAGPEVFYAQAKDQVVSEEINLVSPDTGPLTWILGGAYQDDLLNVPQFIISLAPGGGPTTGFALTALHDTAIRQSWGVFGQASYALTDALKLQIGLRYSETSFKQRIQEGELFNGTVVLALPLSNVTQRDARLTGKIDLDWNLDENNFLYAFIATGHKGGGINGNGAIFKAENVTDYEAGWKSTLLDGHVQTQIDGFYDEYKSFQMSFYDPTSFSGEDQNAAGTTVIDGLEAQIQAVFGGLSASLGGSYVNSAVGTFYAIDSRLTIPPGTPCNSATGPASVLCRNLTGRALPNAPKWPAQLGLQYALDLGDGQTLTPRIDYGLVGARWATVFQDVPFDRLAAQNLFNAQIAFTPDDTWRITAYGTNIFNLHYVSTQLLGNLGFPGAPAQYGIRVS
ncbi:MAG TPA: TonB-dependent receptor, partial [Rhizomicrobium sp.]